MIDRYWMILLVLALGVGVLIRFWFERSKGDDSGKKKCRSAIVAAVVLTYVLTSFSYELIWMRA